MKIAVTAASGKLGASIVNQLVKELSAEQVVALARNIEKARSLGVEVRPGDYNEKSHFDAAFKDIDAVLLVSGLDAPDKRVGQHRNVINAAKDAGVKKIVYTSIIGESSGSSFSPIVASNRQTEDDIRNSGLQWVIGRNGLYIEPDVEYLDNYIEAGKISNCAADGKCSYTTRSELAFAYAKMLLGDKHNSKTYSLTGEAITQQQLTDFFNETFNLKLVYESLSVEEYKKQRTAELGEFLGNIIAGIYAFIRDGSFNVESDYESAAGRKHIAWADYFRQLKVKQ
jgi:NAD(P)H dehydrogenase (quinone)